jgi:hypothetical protein
MLSPIPHGALLPAKAYLDKDLGHFVSSLSIGGGTFTELGFPPRGKEIRSMNITVAKDPPIASRRLISSLVRKPFLYSHARSPISISLFNIDG